MNIEIHIHMYHGILHNINTLISPLSLSLSLCVYNISYVRIKRKEQTFCFLCDPRIETIGSIKERIGNILFHQHPMNTNNNKYTINDLRIVSSTTGNIRTSSNTNIDTDDTADTDLTTNHSNNHEYTIYLDTDTLEYVQETIRKNNNTTKTTTDTTTSSSSSTTTNNNNTPVAASNDGQVQSNDTTGGIILYLLLPIEQQLRSKNNDDEDDDDENDEAQQEQWETIHIVSTDI
jgi:hypothetical protein